MPLPRCPSWLVLFLAVIPLSLLSAETVDRGSAKSEFQSRYFVDLIPDAVRVIMNSEAVVEGMLIVTAEGDKDVQVSETLGKIQIIDLLYGFSSPSEEVLFRRPAGRNYIFAESKTIAPFHGWDNPSQTNVPVIAFLNRIDGQWNLLKVVPAEAEGSSLLIADLKLLQAAGIRKGAVVPAKLSFDPTEHPLAAGVIERLRKRPE